MLQPIWQKSKGFTLIELLVVITIMSIMAAIVVPAVTGTATTGRVTTMTADISTVQNAVERFVGENPRGNESGWPTYKGELPNEGDVPFVWGASFVDKGDGVTIRVFAAEASLNTNGSSTTAKLGPSYLRTAIPHAGATRAANDKVSSLIDGSLAISIKADGDKPNTKLTVSYTASPATGWAIQDVTSGDTHYPVWRIDKTGRVLVNLNASEY